MGKTKVSTDTKKVRNAAKSKNLDFLNENGKSKAQTKKKLVAGSGSKTGTTSGTSKNEQRETLPEEQLPGPSRQKLSQRRKTDAVVPCPAVPGSPSSESKRLESTNRAKLSSSAAMPLIDQQPGPSRQHFSESAQRRSYIVPASVPAGAGDPSVEPAIDMEPSTSSPQQINCIAMDLLMDWSEYEVDSGQNSEPHRDEKETPNEPIKPIGKTYSRGKAAVNNQKRLERTDDTSSGLELTDDTSSEIGE
nr:uncharacterized protein LOC109424206 [Aedes albopictus]